MQTQINRILVFLLLIVMPVGCFLIDGNYQLPTQNNNTVDTVVYHSQAIEFQDTLTSDELVSVLEEESLPEIEDWEMCDFLDYETGATITKGFYYKTEEDGSTVYYIITGTKEPYIIEKRIER